MKYKIKRDNNKSFPRTITIYLEEWSGIRHIFMKNQSVIDKKYKLEIKNI